MLQQVCDYLHNYFDTDEYGYPLHTESGEFSIVGGAVSLHFLQEGQRFRIIGSVFNDGVYTYHESGCTNDDDTDVALADETFTGTICEMRVPFAVLDEVQRMHADLEKYGEALNGPYQSESFGGYSYTRATGADGSVYDAETEVLKRHAKRLKRWKKLC